LTDDEQPSWQWVLTHDELITLARAVGFYYESLQKQPGLSVQDIVAIKNMMSIDAKMPEEGWFTND
jgi:hypothetical protein